ncbi:hypothetical protein BDY19DRAFT_324997 [Irpex rosettiformis]|uniref:Uncharacterized protein n=1 Tax=Irpex rosettiformis TaxID=378272 RepID=A0ACB8TYI7_9APHY|nr:hypothetical protein BDY19DRAFT_324997 [Irpex rosettiformis]
MESPIDPGSPISNSSGESPPPEDILMAESAPTQEAFFDAPLRDNFLGPSNGKRRQPPTGFPPGPSYSVKNRRREESSSGRRGGHQWAVSGERESGNTRLQKDELIDTQLVERLRHDWGDPFDESFLKDAN